MKAISLWNPWASLIGRGKKIETRGWSTSYRGELAIHAAKRWTKEERETTSEEPFRSAILNVSNYLAPLCLPADELEAEEVRLWGMDAKDFLPFGAIVATVNLIDCVRTETLYKKLALMGDMNELAFGNYAFGRWGWVFREDIKILKTPIPYRGEQGIFEIPDSVFEIGG